MSFINFPSTRNLFSCFRDLCARWIMCSNHVRPALAIWSVAATKLLTGRKLTTNNSDDIHNADFNQSVRMTRNFGENILLRSMKLAKFVMHNNTRQSSKSNDFIASGTNMFVVKYEGSKKWHDDSKFFDFSKDFWNLPSKLHLNDFVFPPKFLLSKDYANVNVLMKSRRSLNAWVMRQFDQRWNRCVPFVQCWYESTVDRPATVNLVICSQYYSFPFCKAQLNQEII